jgi:transcriptional regulator with XRE-family HTH domain
MPIRRAVVHEAARRARHQLDALIRDLRTAPLAAGLSQASVAAVIGCSRQLLVDYEAGRVAPNLMVLARWGATLGLDVPIRAFPGGSPLRDAGHLRLLVRAGPSAHLGLANGTARDD